MLEQLLDGLAQYLPPETPRTVTGVVDAVRRLCEAANGMPGKEARTNAAFQKLLQLGDVVAAKLNPGHAVVRCKRCCRRYETPAERSNFPCPHCSAAHIGVGPSFDAACVDAIGKLRRLGHNSTWIVSLHSVYTRDVGDDKADDRLVHMVRLQLEHG